MRLFCYGTLLFPEVMHAVTGQHLECLDAVLEDHACYTVRGQPFPGIVQESGSVTEGVVYTGIGERHLRQLDTYEGDRYVRRRVSVSDRAGKPLQAWAYLMAPACRDQLTAMRWNREAFRMKQLQRYLRTCLAVDRQK
jgi:gamma-glutamylcyclotransferase (GGCT)/AIG2-like uncharacterized protein YtfP